MRIVYLHGLGGDGNSEKAAILRNYFGDETVSSPTLPVDPIETEAIVDKIVRDNTSFPLVFVGLSLGGFWANYFAQKWDAPCVLVNPSVNPSGSLQKYDIPQHILDGYKPYEIPRADSNGALVSLFVAEDDHILPFWVTLDAYKHTAFTSVLPDGGHSFDKNWNLVVNRIAEIVK